MENIKTGITALVAEELAHALLLHGMNNSHHESYAILKEEMEEAATDFVQAQEAFDDVWEDVKANNLHQIDLADLQNTLIHTAAEMVQCIAMVDKWMLLITDPRTAEVAKEAKSDVAKARR